MGELGLKFYVRDKTEVRERTWLSRGDGKAMPRLEMESFDMERKGQEIRLTDTREVWQKSPEELCVCVWGGSKGSGPSLG